ncbi:unnamed protein product [Medioppia subpectinata]|uniref:Uncharacterized protein n=1 Tax=Medioppia subpectinata TaxID=1979941 RepID=A0A7R9Q0E7_9ACAR|nr:unnamed protein product [Medioppia subpectinata]CAG2107480.1 unnamed protein product [Medioppia subpectinata]
MIKDCPSGHPIRHLCAIVVTFGAKLNPNHNCFETAMNCESLDQLLNHFHSKISIITDLFPLSQLYDNYDHKNEWKRNAVLDSNHWIQSTDSSDNYCLESVPKKPDLKEMSQMIVEMKAMIADIKTIVRQQKRIIGDRNTKYSHRLDLMVKHCEHINHNIPAFLTNKGKANEENNELPVKRQTNGHNNNHKPVSKAMPKSTSNAKPVNTTKPNPKSTQNQTARTGGKKCVAKDTSIPSIAFITTEEFATIPQ